MGTLASGAGDTSLNPESLVNQQSTGAKPPIPVEFGRYRILRALGAGAMGTVYLAEDTLLHRQVALKVPQLGNQQDSSRLERFFREARLAATLSHPNICPIYDIGEHEGTHFISMAFVQGRPLSAHLKGGKPVAERTAASLVRKLALALHEAHKHGVIHRDLKPANVMIDQRGEPIVMDFGLARQANGNNEAQITQSGAILGTPAYMSPEQVRGETASVGAPADQYALGVILYQVLSGRLPFEGPVVSVLTQIATQLPVPPSKRRPGLHQDLETICLRAMARESQERFADTAQLANALTQFLKRSSESAIAMRAADPIAAVGSLPEASPGKNPSAMPASPAPVAERNVVPASQRTSMQTKGPVVDSANWWSQAREKRWFWPAACGLGALLAGLVFAAISSQTDPGPKGTYVELAAEQNAAKPEPSPAVENAFPVGAIYRGTWKNFSPGNTEADAETELTITVKERNGTSFVSEWTMHARDAAWIAGGEIVSTDSSQWKIASQDLDLVGGDHPNEGNTSLVAEIVSAVREQPETIRGTAFYRSGSRSEFEATRVSPGVRAPQSEGAFGDSPTAATVPENFDEPPDWENLAQFPDEISIDGGTPVEGTEGSEAPAVADNEPGNPEMEVVPEEPGTVEVQEGVAETGSKKRKSSKIPVDLFPVGSRWTGKYRQWAAGQKAPFEGTMDVTVIARDKGTFRIRSVDDKGAFAAEVDGVIRGNRVEWDTSRSKVEKGAIGRLRIRGQIANGDRLEIKFTGQSIVGEVTSGVGTMHRQP